MVATIVICERTGYIVHTECGSCHKVGNGAGNGALPIAVCDASIATHSIAQEPCAGYSGIGNRVFVFVVDCDGN